MMILPLQEQESGNARFNCDCGECKVEAMTIAQRRMGFRGGRGWREPGEYEGAGFVGGGMLGKAVLEDKAVGT